MSWRLCSVEGLLLTLVMVRSSFSSSVADSEAILQRKQLSGNFLLFGSILCSIFFQHSFAVRILGAVLLKFPSTKYTGLGANLFPPSGTLVTALHYGEAFCACVSLRV